jgi:undecaprenyl-diphosphatase
VNILQAIILGLVQGVTEFVPVSSSGHLIIAHRLLGISETGLAFDVALHLGTLLALVIFFYKDIAELAAALVRKTAYSRLAWLLVFATLPAAVIGVLLEDMAESSFRSVRLVAVNLIVVGVVMIMAERHLAKLPKPTSLQGISGRQAIAVGLAQAAALIPGVSRSGGTISVGLLAGLDRVAAARFSFLLAIPITFGAILKVTLSGNTLSHISQELELFTVGIVTAFVSGLIAIRFLLKFVAKYRLNLFAYYRFALGGLVLLASFLL